MTIKQPPDKSHFILPDLGEGVHEAELIKWRVKPGDTVEEHQTLAEMETDKALVEVPTPWSGIIESLNGTEGDILNVGSVLVTYKSGGTKAVTDDSSGDGDSGGERKDSGTVVGSVDATLTVPTSFSRKAIEENGQPEGNKSLATPAVRRIAKEQGVDINRISGTGRGGRVTAADIMNSAPGTPAAIAPPSRASTVTAPSSPAPLNLPEDGVVERIPFRGVRRKIAESLDRSIKTAVHFSVFNEADVTSLALKREEYTGVIGRKLSYLPFVLTAVCKALRAHPQLNSLVDDEQNIIMRMGTIHLGIAVDTEHGLMVPVLRNADQLSLVQMNEQVTNLAKGCRDRSIPREDLTGSTFTISNVGSYGGVFATPIINYPEVGILAVGRVRESVLTKNGTFYAGKTMGLSMSCDHRVVDGAEGARFLNSLVALLENPEELVR